MPKMKTKKAAAKRFKVLSSGRIKRKAAYRRHIMRHKSTKQKRHLRDTSQVEAVDAGPVMRMLPYDYK